MSKDKQIEEMEIALREAQYELDKAWHECLHNKGAQPRREFLFTAQYLVENKGYRKASEVAREIFEEIEAEMEAAIESNYRAKREHKNHSVIPNYDNFNAMCDGKIYAMRGLLDFIAELKKKYTEGEG